MADVKIALVFPGQGSQCVGMGKDLYDNFPYARELFDSTNDILGYDLKKIIFEGPSEKLRQTLITQPSVFTVSVACFEVFLNQYPQITDYCLYTAGHSLGEYTALYAAKVFNFITGLKLVKSRAEFIQQASDANPGKMAAILGLEYDKVKNICDEMTKKKGSVEMVNFNCPGQIVISGINQAVEEAASLATEAGATKSIVLDVSGPFHSGLMVKASELMSEELEKVTLSNPVGNVVSNYDGEIAVDSNQIRQNLVKQINHPVLWEKSVNRIISEGITTFIEIGPGRVLSGLIGRIDRKVKVLNIEDSKSLESTLKKLEA